MTKRNVGTLILLAVGLPMVAIFNSAQAQSGPDLSFERLQAIAIAPVSINAETGDGEVVPEMLPLFREEEIRYTGGTKYKDTPLKFRLHVPDDMEPGKSYPLILWLHGVGEAGTDNSRQLIHLHHLITYLTGPKKRDFFLLVPQTPSDHTGWDAYAYYRTVTHPIEQSNSLSSVVGRVLSSAKATITETVAEGEDFGDSPLGFSFAMLEQVCEQYPVDRDRITVSGLSSGGDGTWRALERGPDIFAAAVPLVSWNALKDEEIEKSPILKKIPIWAIYSSDDNGIDFAREEFARIEAAGCNVKKSEFGLCGHNAWTPAMLQADIFSWLLSRGKKDGQYVAIADSNVNPDEMQGVIEVAERDSRLPTLAPPKEAVAINRQSLVPTPPSVVVSTSQAIPTVAASTGEYVTVQTIKQTPDPETDDVRFSLAMRYFDARDMEGVERVFQQLSPGFKIPFIRYALREAEDDQLEFIEELINKISQNTPHVSTRVISPSNVVSMSLDNAVVFSNEPASEPIEISPAVRRVVEECEKEWEMSTRTLYGLFAVGWDKESELVPDFVRNSTADELVRHIVDAVQNDGEKFQKLCDSVLKLDNQPMSSPWFETSGGRLQSDIKYSLSSRGKVLQAIFGQLSESNLEQSKLDATRKVLEKIDFILGKAT